MHLLWILQPKDANHVVAGRGTMPLLWFSGPVMPSMWLQAGVQRTNVHFRPNDANHVSCRGLIRARI